jgi:hypothetical protein
MLMTPAGTGRMLRESPTESRHLTLSKIYTPEITILMSSISVRPPFSLASLGLASLFVLATSFTVLTPHPFVRPSGQSVRRRARGL